MSLLGNENEKIGNWGSKDLDHRGEDMDAANDCIWGKAHVGLPPPPMFIRPHLLLFSNYNQLLSI